MTLLTFTLSSLSAFLRSSKSLWLSSSSSSIHAPVIAVAAAAAAARTHGQGSYNNNNPMAIDKISLNSAPPSLTIVIGNEAAGK